MASIHCYLLHSHDSIRMERYNTNKSDNKLNKFNINFNELLA